MNRIRIPVNPRPRKLRSAIGLGSGPEGRIEKIRRVVTELFREERIEGSYKHIDESQGYAELLIQQAILNGPKHAETRELANFWLMGDEDLVEKLFGVVVPRLQDSVASYTNQHQLPNKYPENHQRAVLELRGNPFPPVVQEQDTSKWINNVLLESARRKYGTRTVREAVTHDTETDVRSRLTQSFDQAKPDSGADSGTPV